MKMILEIQQGKLHQIKVNAYIYPSFQNIGNWHHVSPPEKSMLIQIRMTRQAKLHRGHKQVQNKQGTDNKTPLNPW